MSRFQFALLASGFVLAVTPQGALAQQASDPDKGEVSEVRRNSGYVDLAGSLGYSRNPFLSTEADGSVFGRASIFGTYQLNGDRHTTDVTAFGEGSYYFNQKNSTKLARIDVQHRYKASETTSLFGGVGFSVDYGSQLSNRFLTLPQPQPGDPDVIIDPALLNGNRKSYRLNGNAGVSFKVSERDSVTLGASDQRVWYGKNLGDLDFNTIALNADWTRTLSERSSFGTHFSGEFSDYAQPGLSTQVYTLQGTLSRFLAENWEAKLGAGASYVIRKSLAGDDKSISPAVDASICRQLSTESICAEASYGVRTSIDEALKTAMASVTYQKRINEKDNVHAGLSVSHYSGGLRTPTTNYVSAAAGYNRRFSDRLSGSVDLSGRDIFRKNGDDIPFDATGIVSIHYRLGDVPR